MAGLLLGPSFLGWLAPRLYDGLFRNESLGALNALSQVGILLFMFQMGTELDLQQVRRMRGGTVQTSVVSMIVPFIAALGLAHWLRPVFSNRETPFLHFALFLGTAMSVTAFPVLARILRERNMLGTKIGTMAISCAALDDVIVWCVLAVAVTMIRGQTSVILPFLVLLYLIFLWFGIRPLLQRFVSHFQRDAPASSNMLAVLLLFTVISSWATEALGIHALFGAFLAGIFTPRMPAFINDLRQKLEPVSTVLLLPLFFAFTGLRTRIGLLRGPRLWIYCLAMILVAMIGKWGGAAVSARYTGFNWREAITVGILMNTRGLVELVILNVGLDLKILSPALFSIMVIMALATTFMTTPLLQWMESKEATVLTATESADA